MKNGRMQAKDITTLAFVQAIVVCGIERESSWATRWDVGAVLAGYPEHVGEAPVTYPEMPDKVVLAKAKALIAANVIEGCTCGCRGDFRLPAETLGLVRSPGPVGFWTLPESVPKLMTMTRVESRPLLRAEKIRIRKIARLFGLPDWIGGPRYSCTCPRCGWRVRCPNLGAAWRLSRGHIRKRHAGG